MYSLMNNQINKHYKWKNKHKKCKNCKLSNKNKKIKKIKKNKNKKNKKNKNKLISNQMIIIKQA